MCRDPVFQYLVFAKVSRIIHPKESLAVVKYVQKPPKIQLERWLAQHGTGDYVCFTSISNFRYVNNWKYFTIFNVNDPNSGLG